MCTFIENTCVLTEVPICAHTATEVGCPDAFTTLFDYFIWIALAPSGHTVANVDRDKRGSYP
jgi:hypothetical protein